jgi:hypothetical protein
MQVEKVDMLGLIESSLRKLACYRQYSQYERGVKGSRCASQGNGRGDLMHKHG